MTATSTPLPSTSCTQTEEPEIAEKELISVSTVQNLSFSFLGPNVSVAERVAFIEKHPFQPDNKDVKNWNADTFSIYTRTLPNGEQVQRIWELGNGQSKEFPSNLSSLQHLFSIWN